MNKSYPRSQFVIVDNTSAQEIAQSSVTMPLPMTMAAYTSDKGPENWRLLFDLKSLTNETGSISFTKHGQAQLTVAEQLRAGAVVFCKRMVSEDATLANTTVRARVIKSNNVSYVYFYTKSGLSVADFDTACEVGYDDFNPDAESETVDVPLFTVTPMGRGASNMFFRIAPNYTSSKSSTYISYSFEVYENQQLIESTLFTMNPDIIIDGVSQAMNPKIKAYSKQVKVNLYEDGLYALMTALVETATDGTNPISISDLINMDFINGYDRRGTAPIGGIVTSADITAESGTDLWTTNKPSDIETAYDLSDAIGIPLVNGSYGTMGNSPMSNPIEYEKMLLGTFGANQESVLFDPVIYDVDANKIDFIADCAYPTSVKNAIIDLIDFRGDMVFLADLGVGVKNLSNIKEAVSVIKETDYAAVYHNFFKIYDPYNYKQITVTLPYLLSTRMINHISNGVGRPFAGMLYGITFPEIIEGTINFIPVEIPGVNQKQELVDINVNYLGSYDGIPTLETMYVHSAKYTQLSFLHNIMAVQEVIKAIRTKCPKVRYTFLDGSDLEEYLADANAVINKYTTNFKSISMQYMADEIYENNNIFYAVLNVSFKNFVHEEYFKVIAIND